MNLFGECPVFRVMSIVNAPGWCHGPRIQFNLQLVYLYKGEMSVQVDSRSYRVKAGEATLLLPGHREFFRFSPTRPTYFGKCMVIDPRIDPQVLRAYSKLPSKIPFTRRMKTLHALACPLDQDQRKSVRLQFQALAQALFLEFLQEAHFMDEEVKPLPEAVQRARDYMDTRYHEEIHLQAVARVAGVSAAHLTRLFRQHLAVSPIEFLWKIRVEHGARLLAETSLGIKEIAAKVGFQTPYHFSRLIKKQFGYSPTLYRQRTW